ncbi:MAG: hypothetical protein O2822_06655, partial [Chloroflexi bacterium]|nr:hypothetical protein [Chloroflexota bacterium]
RDALAKWVAAGKKALSTGRQTVAHADTAFIKGITEDGLWAPLALAGGLTEEALVETLRHHEQSDAGKFGWRSEQLIKTAVLALAQCEAELGATARLIQAKRPRPAYPLRSIGT